MAVRGSYFPFKNTDQVQIHHFISCTLIKQAPASARAQGAGSALWGPALWCRAMLTVPCPCRSSFCLLHISRKGCQSRWATTCNLKLHELNQKPQGSQDVGQGRA